MTTHTHEGTDTTGADNVVSEVDLAITGMTCASCSARVEKKLNRLEGVDATVNLATEKAKVRFTAPVTVAQVMATVEKTGYGARLLTPPPSASHQHAAGSSTPEHGSAGEAAQHDGHDHLEDIAPVETLRRRALISAALTVPIVVLAMVPGMSFSGNPWIQLALATPVVLWAAWPFHRAAAINARHLASTMDTLVSIGVSAAYLYSVVGVVTGGAGDAMAGMSGGQSESTHLYFETAAVITTFLLIGRWLEARAKKQGKSALETLLSLGAKDVAVLRDGSEHRIPIEDLAVGEQFVVRPGEKVATDGTVVEGSSAVDASMMTGEPVPVDVTPGDDVIGGTVNAHGRLIVRATAVGAQTTLAAMARLVEDAQTGKAPVQRLADRVSAVFVPVVLVIATLTLVGWWVGTGDFTRALPVAITVLIIACPCALGLATPTALLVGTGRGAELGVLIKGPQILEDTRRVNTVLLDKTGTVTTGAMTLHGIDTDGLTEEAALLAAAAVESGSEHPIARAVTAAATARGLTVPRIRDFTALAGSGARATVLGSRAEQDVTVGRADLFSVVPESIANGVDSTPGTRIFVGWDGRARAALTVTDTVRETSAQAIADLAGLGLTAYLLTGDNEVAARSVATAVGIPHDRVIADVRPADKYAVVERLQREGRVVAMVGDGVNDAAALAQADLGLAMGSGTDVAMHSADIVLMRTDLATVPTAIALSRATLRTIKVNLGWAFAYNTAAIPLAVAGLLNPMIAGGAMALSSVLVVTNSLRLRRFGR